MSMPELTIKVDEAQLAELQARLRDFPKQIPKILARAMNRASSTMRSRIVKLVAKRAGIKQKLIRKRIWFRKANATSLWAMITGGKSGWPLIAMGAKQTKRGVTIRRAPKTKRELLAHAFIAKMPSGHVGVFVRKPGWTHRLPRGRTSGRKHGLAIKEQYGSSLVEYLNEVGALPEIVAEGEQVIHKRMVAETDRLLAKKGLV